jgi:hypothetical protein
MPHLTQCCYRDLTSFPPTIHSLLSDDLVFTVREEDHLFWVEDKSVFCLVVQPQTTGLEPKATHSQCHPFSTATNYLGVSAKSSK